MEQHNFRVKFSLGTKLILSLSLLFLLIVGFLSYSAVKLVIDDKQAYTFQIQSMEAHIAGQDFNERVRPTVDALRLYLSTFDPRTPITPAQNENLKNLVKSQQDSPLVLSYLVKADGTATNLTQTANEELLQKTGIKPEQVLLDSASFKTLREHLLESGFAFQAYTKTNGSPLVLVAFGDIGLKDFEKGMPVAIAVLEMKNLVPNARFGETTITDRGGQVLVSSNPKKILEEPDQSQNPIFIGASSGKISTGIKEFDLGGVAYLGAYRKLSNGPVVMTQLNKRKAMAAAFTLGERLALMGVISIIAAILFAIIFSGSITRPLKKLTMATAAVASGDFNVKTNIATSDEVGALSASFDLMSKKIQELIIDSVKAAHLEDELKVASAVQENLIPPSDYRDDQFEIVGSYQSASECGGDWWGFFRIKNKLCVMIADATGHGVPSALITASARSCFSVLAKLAQEKAFFRLAPGEMMSYANRVVFDAAMTKIMMTFFIGVIDLETKTITYSNAGHNPPWLFKKNGERFQLKSLMPKGNRLGETEDSGDFEEMTVPMDLSDILFLYTDGLMENKNVDGEQYGKKRVKEVVEGSLVNGPRGIIDALKTAYMEYNGKTKSLDDDVTLALIRIHSAPVV